MGAQRPVASVSSDQLLENIQRIFINGNAERGNRHSRMSGNVWLGDALSASNIAYSKGCQGCLTYTNFQLTDSHNTLQSSPATVHHSPMMSIFNFAPSLIGSMRPAARSSIWPSTSDPPS